MDSPSAACAREEVPVTVRELIAALNAFPMESIVLISAGPEAIEEEGMLPIAPPIFMNVRGPDPSALLALGTYVPDEYEPRSPYPLTAAVVIYAPKRADEPGDDESDDGA